MLELSLVLLGLIIVFVAWAYNNSQNQRRVEREILGLSSRLTDLEARLHHVEHGAPGQVSLPSEPVTATPRASVVASQPPTVVTPLPAPSTLFPAPTPPSKTKAEWESLIGGKLLNRIGALALIIGVGFFLKYAFDNNWITETARIFIGGSIGVALLVIAAASRKHGFSIFAQGLVGAGIAVLYLSVFASFNFYFLVSQPVAFSLMAGVTVIAFTQAFQYDSLAVSLLGWFGGFITPFLLSTGVSNEVGLFTYIMLLDAGLIAIVIRKSSWAVLEPLALGATYVIYFAWYLKYYSVADLGQTVVFLLLFWSIFFAERIYHEWKGGLAFKQFRLITGGGNALLLTANLYALVNPDHHEWMGAVTLAIGVLYGAAGYLVRRGKKEGTQSFAEFLLIAIVLLIAATAIQFVGYTTVMLWTAEALALLWVGLRLELRFVWISSLVLFIIALFKLLGTEGALAFTPIAQFAPILNRRSCAFLLLAVTSGAGAVFFGSGEKREHPKIADGLHFGWTILVFVVLTVDTVDFFRVRLVGSTGEEESHLMFTLFMVLSSVWALYSLPLLSSSLHRKLQPLMTVGLLALLLGFGLTAIRGITYDPISRFSLLWNERVLAILIVLGSGMLVNQWLRSGRSALRVPDEIPVVLRASIVLLILLLLTSEARDFFERKIWAVGVADQSHQESQLLSTLENLKQLLLSGIWLFYSIILMVFGIWRRTRAFRLISIVLFGLTILKIFVYDLSFLETLYRIFSFMGLGVILLVVSYLYQRYKAIIFEDNVQQ